MKATPVQQQDVDISLLDAEVIRRFEQIPEVTSIFQRTGDDGALFWVFTSNPTYSDELMDRLIDVEMTLLDSYPEISQSYRYIPDALVNRRESIVGDDLAAIFRN